MPINPNARTENISFREGAAWMWNYINQHGWDEVSKAQAETNATLEANRRYPDYDPLPQPTSAPKGGMEP